MSTVPFTLRLDEEIKLQLEEEAVADARSASYIAAKAIKQYLDARNLERLAMEEAVQEADKGAFVSSGAMRNWIASWGSDAELSPPAADVFLRERKKHGEVRSLSIPKTPFSYRYRATKTHIEVLRIWGHRQQE